MAGNMAGGMRASGWELISDTQVERKRERKRKVVRQREKEEGGRGGLSLLKPETLLPVTTVIISIIQSSGKCLAIPSTGTRAIKYSGSLHSHPGPSSLLWSSCSMVMRSTVTQLCKPLCVCARQPLKPGDALPCSLSVPASSVLHTCLSLSSQ